MDYNYDQWNAIILKYRKGEINIGVNLPLARQFLINTTNKYSIYSLLLWSIVPLIVCISAFSIYKLWGILFSIVYILMFFSTIGMASYSFEKTSSWILTSGIITVIILFFTSFHSTVPFILSVISYIFVYTFYYSIGKTIINNYALAYFDTFKYMINNKIISINKDMN